MADFLSDLASKSGLENDQVHQGVGALLTMLKSRLDPAALAHLQKAIPNSDQMVAGFEDKKQWSSAGLIDAVKGAASKMLGGDQDPVTALKSHFASIGLSPDHLKALLPNLYDVLASKMPPQVLEQIKQHVPGFSPAEETVQQE
jgi:Protein of unknown function VcgC/VcgE (DUF2780)